MAQCAATSVDALTVGFTIEEYAVYAALACSAIIAATTFVVYLVGFFVGKKFGMRFEKVASVVGGAVFIAIAVEIIITTYRTYKQLSFRTGACVRVFYGGARQRA